VRRLVEQYVFGDTVGLADWALNQAGAVVLPQTSAPFYTPISERTVADFLALRRAVAMPPEVALSPDNTDWQLLRVRRRSPVASRCDSRRRCR
jgi:hypothetical protein